MNTKIESSREFSMEITIYSPGLLAKASIHFEGAMSIPEFFSVQFNEKRFKIHISSDIFIMNYGNVIV